MTSTTLSEAAAQRRQRTAGAGPGLLCVANFPSNTGYAWDFIEGQYRAMAERLATAGVRTWVAYPRMEAPPATLAGSVAQAVQLDVRFDTPSSLKAVLDFVRRERIRVVYLSDRSAWSPAYALLRLAGVRWIVVHDHTSGHRTAPTGLKRWLKEQRRHIPGTVPDRVVAVSDFVARRKIEVDLVPSDRVQRIWNSCAVPLVAEGARDRLRLALAIEGDGPVVVCACRATPEKGVAHLFRAFDRVCAGLPPGEPRPTLVYFGDGPDREALMALRNTLTSARMILMAGYRSDAVDLIAGGDVCVVPSVWAEAFGLAALEPMARGVPVIASRVGGIPEIVIDGETGVLTEPGDEDALARALLRLLDDPGERRRLGENGVRRTVKHFSPESAVQSLVDVVKPGFSTGSVSKVAP